MDRWAVGYPLENESLHVWPLRETDKHNLESFNCQCEPKLEIQENGVILIVHNEEQ